MDLDYAKRFAIDVELGLSQQHSRLKDIRAELQRVARKNPR